MRALLIAGIALTSIGCPEAHRAGSCPDGRLDCDGLTESGCEVDGTTVLACGACDNPCERLEYCESGTCRRLEQNALSTGAGTVARDLDGHLLGVGEVPTAFASEPLETWTELEPGRVTSTIATGNGYVCAADDRVVRCRGQSPLHLATGSVPEEWDTASLPSPVHALVGGTWHVCALIGGGSVWCAGSNGHGQLGLPDPSTISGTFVEIVDLPPIRELVGGTWHACGLTEEGDVWCWGGTDYGVLGAPPVEGEEPFHAPARVPIEGAARLAGDTWRTCTFDAEGRVTCWGWLDHLTGVRLVSGPAEIDWLGTGVVNLAHRRSGACAIYEDGRMRCLRNGEAWAPPPLELGDDGYVMGVDDAAAFTGGFASPRITWDGDPSPWLILKHDSSIWLLGGQGGTLGELTEVGRHVYSRVLPGVPP